MFENLKNEKISLCELLIIRSLIDLVDHITGEVKWRGITKKPDNFTVELDFIASRIGYYSWRQIFYSEKFESSFKEDQELSKILYNFVKNKRKRKDIPKITDFSSQSNQQMRQEIIKNCLTENILEKTKKDFGLFEISKNKKYIIIQNTVIDSLEPIRQIDFIISQHFPDSIPSFISTKKRISKKIRKKDFDRIKEIQNNVCFFCRSIEIQTQDHYIPETFLHETKPSNIVGACHKCNRRKWHKEPPDEEDFQRILKRNEDYSEVIESDYDTVEYRKKFERFKRITSSHS